MPLPRLAPLALASALAACSASSETPTDTNEGEVEKDDGAPALCAGVRGNGENIGAHFASLARIVEHYGLVDGMAGGSSGSITTFLYESILMNPATLRCGGQACSRDAAAARVALALKSIHMYGATLAEADEGKAIRDLAGVAGRLKADFEANGIAALAQRDAVEAANSIRVLLSNPDVRDLANPQYFAMLSDAQHLSFNVREISTAITTLGAFSVDDNRLFFREGALNWQALAKLFGRVGSFYAGYGPADVEGMRAWLDACAAPTRGLSWEEAANVKPEGAAATCGASFAAMVTSYREKAQTEEGKLRSRLDDHVGDESPLKRKLISTSVLEGAGVKAYEDALRTYRSGAHATGSIPMSITFGDVHFGYWGAPQDLERVAANARGFDDAKTMKMSSLGNGTWREILTASPAEPGLSRFVKLPDGRISAGGWSDLAPSLVLKNLGCKRVVYVTRRGDESQFAVKIAAHLGMDEQAWRDLYDLSNDKSSFSRSVAQADAVWCTDWNAFRPSQQRELAADAYAAPIETRAGWKGLSALRPYPHERASLDLPGCTPGVSAGATFPRR
jgi:hypothetical protein